MIVDQNQNVSNDSLENGYDIAIEKPVNIRIPVTAEFWEELSVFLVSNGVTASALKHAGMNYNTARKIVKGSDSRSVTSTHMQILMAVIKNPENFKKPEPLGAINSIEEMMGLESMIQTSI